MNTSERLEKAWDRWAGIEAVGAGLQAGVAGIQAGVDANRRAIDANRDAIMDAVDAHKRERDMREKEVLSRWLAELGKRVKNPKDLEVISYAIAHAEKNNGDFYGWQTAMAGEKKLSPQAIQSRAARLQKKIPEIAFLLGRRHKDLESFRKKLAVQEEERVGNTYKDPREHLSDKEWEELWERATPEQRLEIEKILTKGADGK